MTENKGTTKTLKAIKAVIWLSPVILFIWLVNNYFVPGGTLEIKYQAGDTSNIVKNFASKEIDRIIGSKNVPGSRASFQMITTTPLYFDVKVPRPFQKATVRLKYQNPYNQPEIKLGIRSASGAYHYEDLAFAHPSLENLPEYWHKIQEGDLILWQKDKLYKEEKLSKQEEFNSSKTELDDWRAAEEEKIEEKYLIGDPELAKAQISEMEKEIDQITQKYQEDSAVLNEKNIVAREIEYPFASIEDFWANLPDPEKILEYNYNLSAHEKVKDYQKSTSLIELTKSLRGRHSIYTYIGEDEDLNFTFTVQDINRHEGQDVYKIVVYDKFGEIIKEYVIPDDGVVAASGQVLAERTISVLLEDIPFGTYRLAIDTNDDVFTKKIVTFQHLVMFKGGVYLTDNEEYQDILGDKELTPTTLYTNSSVIKVRTSHDDGFQTLTVGNRQLKIDEKHVLKEVEELEGVSRIVVPKNDVYISGNGYFAFSEEQLFNRYYASVNDLERTKNVDDYDYIFAEYPQATEEGEWLVAETSVTVPDLYFQKDKDILANFIIDLPGLPESNRMIKVKGLEITFEKEKITMGNVFTKLKDWLSRNLNGEEV